MNQAIEDVSPNDQLRLMGIDVLDKLDDSLLSREGHIVAEGAWLLEMDSQAVVDDLDEGLDDSGQISLWDLSVPDNVIVDLLTGGFDPGNVLNSAVSLLEARVEEPGSGEGAGDEEGGDKQRRSHCYVNVD